MTSAPPSGQQISASAQSGFSNAALYDQHRPSFPAHSVDVLLEGIRVADNPKATVVDLAAGTGKFTELLASRDEGYEIVAVEPHLEMRKVLQDKHLRGVSVHDGLSTDMKFLGDESVDAVIAAQVGRRGKKEIIIPIALPNPFTPVPHVTSPCLYPNSSSLTHTVRPNVAQIR